MLTPKAALQSARLMNLRTRYETPPGFKPKCLICGDCILASPACCCLATCLCSLDITRCLSVIPVCLEKLFTRLTVFDSARWHSSNSRPLQALDKTGRLHSNPVQLRSLRRRVETQLRRPMTAGASEQHARHCRSALAIDHSRGQQSCRRGVSRRR